VTAARHATWALLLGPACFHPTYDHPACGPSNTCPDGLICSAQQICEAAGAAIDAASDGPAGDTESDGPAPGFCDPTDPHLVACYELDGDGKDSSSHHLDAFTANVTFVAGKVGLALQSGSSSSVATGDSPTVDIAALTIEAWVRPSQLPPGAAVAYILDVDKQYALRIGSSGNLDCVLTGATSVMANANLAINQWAHVACTFDSAIGAAIYVDGTQIGSAAAGGALATDGTSGMTLGGNNPPGSGSRLIGSLDEVRLMNIARTPAQICADAERSSCP
jgi:hypothetical protein